MHSLQNKVNYQARDIVENKHTADQKIAKMITHEEFAKVVSQLEDKLSLETNHLNTEVGRLKKDVEHLENQLNINRQELVGLDRRW